MWVRRHDARTAAWDRLPAVYDVGLVAVYYYAYLRRRVRNDNSAET